MTRGTSAHLNPAAARHVVRRWAQLEPKTTRSLDRLAEALERWAH